MRQIRLAIIAKLPTYVTWCEKKYPNFQLMWFKTPQDYEANSHVPNGCIEIVLTEQSFDTSELCINLNDINLYKNPQKLEQFIDSIVLYSTLSSTYTTRPSELPLL